MISAMEDALSRLARRLRGPHARVRTSRRLSGGASLETWAFAVATGDAVEEMILRRRASASRSEIVLSLDMKTEAALLQSAALGGVPVPAFVHLCDDRDDLGEAYVMRHVPGEALGRRITSDARFATVRPLLTRQCGEILARIHAMPTPLTGLDTEHAHAVIDRYEAIYRASDPKRPVLELCFRHLREHAPAGANTVLLHGDFRNGNLLIDTNNGITAVLDWELAHCGDPAEDLGWLCVNSWRFGHADLPVGGFGQYDDLIEAYARAGGQAMTLARVRYWQAIGSLKWAVMCMGMYHSWKSGLTRSVERPMIGRRISEAEMDLVHLLETGFSTE